MTTSPKAKTAVTKKIQTKVDLYDLSGEKAETLTLNPEIFDIKVSKSLIHTALVRQHNNARLSLAKTKTRAERRGGGRKPFKQKHTGNARAGTRRSPLWRKGGVIFGPRGVENYTTKLNSKARTKALLSTLTTKAQNEEILGLTQYEDLKPKTKELALTLKKLPIKRSVLIVAPTKIKNLYLSANNIPYAKVIQANYLNIHDLLKYENVLILKEAFDVIEKLWGSKKPETEIADEKKVSKKATSTNNKQSSQEKE